MPARGDRRRWTYAELLDEAEGTARVLLGRFDPGERVAVWANNIPEWIQLQMGAALAGLTLVTVDPALRSAELLHVLGQSRASGVFLRSEYRGNPMAATLRGIRGQLPLLREAVLFDEWEAFRSSGVSTRALPEVSPDDAVQIQYTSGTTGVPKGAVLSHRGIVNNARLSYPPILHFRRGDSPEHDAAIPHCRERARDAGADRGTEHARAHAVLRPGAVPPARRRGARR